jgi:opacity protein-like surface antigen
MVAGLAISAPAGSASAQDFNPFEIGGAIGAAVLDAAYNEFGIKDVEDGNFNIPSFTANAIFKLPTGGFTPYLIGGAGLYRPGGEVAGFSDSENKFGWNAGGGISMPLSGFKVFVEARFNQVRGSDGDPNVNFVPITFGAIF